MALSDTILPSFATFASPCREKALHEVSAAPARLSPAEPPRLCPPRCPRPPLPAAPLTFSLFFLPPEVEVRAGGQGPRRHLGRPLPTQRG